MAIPFKFPDSFDCCPIAATETFRDYNQAVVSNHVLPVLQERLQYEIAIDEGTFVSTCMLKYATKYGVAVLPFLDYVRSIQVTVFKEHIDYPVAGQSVFEIYFSQKLARDKGFSSNWVPGPATLNGTLSVRDTGIAPITATLDFRVRWENNLAPALELAPDNAFPSERIPILGTTAVAYRGALNSNFNWAGENIFIETQLNLNTTNLPFSFDVVQVNRAKMVPYDYEENTLRGIDTIELFYQPSGDPVIGRVCRDLGDSVLVKVHKTIVGSFNLIAFFDTPSFTTGTLQEDEDYLSGTAFTQLDAVELIDVDSVYDGSDHAYFKIDLSTFTQNEIRIAAIAKPV